MRLPGARLIVEFLKETGVRHIFGLSGHSLFPITDALYAEPAIRYVPVMHELCGAYMAVAYARATRRLGICLASSGGGATNLVTGIAYAHKESCPLIALASDVSSDVAGKGASSWHEVPQEQIFRPITKLSVTLKEGRVIEQLREAARLATTGRKGPVYVGIPRDLQTAQVDLPALPQSIGVTEPTAPDMAAVEKAARELQEASAPILIAGGGVYWAGAEEELKGLAELLSIPFATTPSHKGLVSEDHPLALGVLGFGAFPFANQISAESDLLLAVGATFSEGLTLGYGNKVIPAAARIIQVDLDAREIGKSYPVHLPIVGDAKAVLRGLIEALKRRGTGKRNAARLERIARAKDLWREKLLAHGYEPDDPINQWHLYRALREATDEEAIVVGAGGTAELIRRFVARSYVYHSGEFRVIGHGLSTSIGLALAVPSRPVVCVTGDGSFMLETQEMATAAALGLPIAIVVIRNGAYGNMKRDQIKHYGGRVIGTDLYLPDFCALASSYGVAAERVERPPDLVPAIKRMLALKRPALLDVVCPIEGI